MAEQKVLFWPSRGLVCTLLAFLFAVLVFAAGVAVQYQFSWNFAQRAYLKDYLSANTVGRYRDDLRYPLLFYRTRGGQERIVTSDEAEAVTLPDGSAGSQLTEAGRQAGAVSLGWKNEGPDEGVSNEKLRRKFDQVVYRSALDQLTYPGYCSLFILAVGLCFAVPKDGERLRLLQAGRVVEGPLLVSATEFNRGHAADGVGFLNHDRSLTEKLWGTGKAVRIPRAEENDHMLFMGDTGTGKTALIRQLLDQIEVRGEGAIIYDAKPEYVTEYYQPDRGDYILNPLDARMPYWDLEKEIENDAEALALSTAAIKEDPRDHPFFVQTARDVLAELLKCRPTAQELTYWLSHPAEIEKRMKGTAYESSIPNDAPNQRQGVLGSLALVYNSFRSLPSKDETTRTWNSVEWSRNRNGWLFITSRPKFLEHLRPIDSLWLDMLVLRLMSDRRPDRRKTWFILDEVATLNKLPQLHAALTLGRDAGNPVVLGFQGRSQLDSRYGGDAETMLSQPHTKVFLRTSHPASEDVSKALGWQRKQYLRESYTNGGQKDTRTHSLEIKSPEPMVMDSDISGLKSFTGYMRRESAVVRLSFKDKHYKKLVPRHPDLVERKPSKTTVSTEVDSVPDEKPFFE
jgi:hypothetical protein